MDYFRRFLVMMILALGASSPSLADTPSAQSDGAIAVGQVYDFVGKSGGGSYVGEMRVNSKNQDGELQGEIDLKVATADGRRYTVRQDLRLAQSGGHVDIRCFHPREIEGHFFKYSSDHFALDRAAPGVYKGGGADRVGQDGDETLTLRMQ
jgi:hypothetical protein